VENYEQPPYRPLKHRDDGGAPADRPLSRRPRKVVPDEASLRKWGLYK
jgi:hypothetical protein